MLKPTAAVLALLIPFAAQAADSQGRFATKGAGRVTCAEFVKAVQEQSDLYPRFLGWLEGYFSAINQFTPETYDITPFVEMHIIANVVGSNCQKRPEMNFMQMARAVTNSIRSQRLHEASPLIDARVGERTMKVYPETLRRVQRELADGGYFRGDINGLFGEDSVEALKAFQADRNLEVTGIPDSPTLVAIFRDISSAQPAE